MDGEDQLNVLLVEDSDAHAEWIRHLAAAGGDDMCLERVDRLSAALERLDQGGVDVVLLDLCLADSGLGETLPAVMARAVDVPVVVLTSLDDAALAGQTVQLGAQDFLPKSQLDAATLTRTIRMAIERKKSRHDLETHATKVDRSNERLRSFIHVLAHEVKSPLTTVTACLSILQERYGWQFDEETRGFVHDSQAAIRGMSDLMNTLLEFARLGFRPQEFAEVDLEEAFYKVYANLRAVIKETGATVTHDPLPTVWGDDLQLCQLLQNLIVNAIKYRGPSPPAIHLGVEEDPEQWTISVRDNGVGVPAEHRERIFAAFVRLANAEQVPGTGIGLALCKVIAENHGGHIWLESEPGEGSVFRFTLSERKPATAPAPLEEVALAAAEMAV